MHEKVFVFFTKLPDSDSVASAGHILERVFITRAGYDVVAHGLVAFPPWSV